MDDLALTTVLDFEEVGGSGRVWDRDSILAMLESESVDPDLPTIEIDDLRDRTIAPGVSRVSWTSAQGSAACDVRRSGASGRAAGVRSITKGLS